MLEGVQGMSCHDALGYYNGAPPESWDCRCDGGCICDVGTDCRCRTKCTCTDEEVWAAMDDSVPAGSPRP